MPEASGIPVAFDLLLHVARAPLDAMGATSMCAGAILSGAAAAPSILADGKDRWSTTRAARRFAAAGAAARHQYVSRRRSRIRFLEGTAPGIWPADPGPALSPCWRAGVRSKLRTDGLLGEVYRTDGLAETARIHRHQ